MQDETQPFAIPDFQTKPFVWDETQSVIASLQAIPYDESAPPKAGISPQEGEQLLNWMMAGTTGMLERLFPRRNRDWTEYCKAKCVIANAIEHDLAQDLPENYIHSFNMQHLSGTPHAAMILRLPVETSVGTWEWKHYLLDPTLAQFADTRCARLLATPAGAEFGTQLLTHGYAELTEAAAACYIDAFIPPILRKQWRQEFNENNCSSIAILCQPNARQGNNNADFLCNIKERLGHSP